MLLIGFGHRARQGKNTAADAILDVCPLETDVHQYAFADALRSEVRTACAKFGTQYDLIKEWQLNGIMPDWVHFEEPKPRSLLQWWGTDYRRTQDPLYWVKKLRATLSQHNVDVALITDVRFPNEGDFIHELGGHVVKCTRIGATDVDVHEHASESEMDGYTGWDFFIEAATVAENHKQALDIFAKVAPDIYTARITAPPRKGLRVSL